MIYAIARAHRYTYLLLLLSSLWLYPLHRCIASNEKQIASLPIYYIGAFGYYNHLVSSDARFQGNLTSLGGYGAKIGRYFYPSIALEFEWNRVNDHKINVDAPSVKPDEQLYLFQKSENFLLNLVYRCDAYTTINPIFLFGCGVSASTARGVNYLTVHQSNQFVYKAGAGISWRITQSLALETICNLNITKFFLPKVIENVAQKQHNSQGFDLLQFSVGLVYTFDKT